MQMRQTCYLDQEIHCSLNLPFEPGYIVLDLIVPDPIIRWFLLVGLNIVQYCCLSGYSGFLSGNIPVIYQILVQLFIFFVFMLAILSDPV